MAYLARWRLLLAARILRDEGLSIREAADRVGYEADAAFSRAFKRQFGVAPGRYRERTTGDIGCPGSEGRVVADQQRPRRIDRRERPPSLLHRGEIGALRCPGASALTRAWSRPLATVALCPN